MISLLSDYFPDCLFSFTKGFRRKLPVVEGIEIITTVDRDEAVGFFTAISDIREENEQLYFKGINIHLQYCKSEKFSKQLFLESASGEFLEAWSAKYTFNEGLSENEQFKNHGLAYIPPETREGSHILEHASDLSKLDLIDYQDIKGVVHTHSTYSDGANTIEQMADECMRLGYEYLVISDHSKSAFYANGLTEERIYRQSEEIDELNQKFKPFRIFKSVECDILGNGNLDYSDDILHSLDLVIASVHANLKMDESKATHRLLRAIENPYTRILGHPTGRLLLSRKGYPINHEIIIDACAEENVVIEINASPYRLDLDWTWIGYAQERGVLLSINPDAHSISGIQDIQYGVDAARKGALTKSFCLNSKSCREFEQWLDNV